MSAGTIRHSRGRLEKDGGMTFRQQTSALQADTQPENREKAGRSPQKAIRWERSEGVKPPERQPV